MLGSGLGGSGVGDRAGCGRVVGGFTEMKIVGFALIFKRQSRIKQPSILKLLPKHHNYRPLKNRSHPRYYKPQ